MDATKSFIFERFFCKIYISLRLECTQATWLLPVKFITVKIQILPSKSLKFCLNCFYFKLITGNRGIPGSTPPPGKPVPNRGFFFTYHSQTEMVPPCPKYTKQMWSGYSLLHFMGDAKAHGQDLGNYLNFKFQ